MQKRRLGRTGHQSSLAILGGAAFFKDTPEEARPTLDEALAKGVNHLDIAPGYGLAERAVGPHMPELRDRFFLAGKTSELVRSKAEARLEKTLTRLPAVVYGGVQIVSCLAAGGCARAPLPRFGDLTIHDGAG